MNKLKLSVLSVVFVLSLFFSQITKKNLNTITYHELVSEIKGVGNVKATHILSERDVNGYFKNKEDFKVRVVLNDKYKVGETVYDRIINTYSIK